MQIIFFAKTMNATRFSKEDKNVTRGLVHQLKKISLLQLPNKSSATFCTKSKKTPGLIKS